MPCRLNYMCIWEEHIVLPGLVYCTCTPNQLSYCVIQLFKYSLTFFFLLDFSHLLRKVLTVSPNDSGFVRRFLFRCLAVSSEAVLPSACKFRCLPPPCDWLHQWGVTISCLSVLLCEANSSSLLGLIEWCIFFPFFCLNVFCFHVPCFIHISIAKLYYFKPVL